MADRPPAYVVDTNVISNRGAAEADPVLVEWLGQNATLIRLSVVTLAEMQRGLILLDARITTMIDLNVKVRSENRLKRKRAWYDEVTRRFADRIIPIDLAIAERWAAVSVRFPSLKDADKAITATALARGYGVATENLGDFRHAGLHVVNPFDRTTWSNPPSTLH